jgi:hypothetical protein
LGKKGGQELGLGLGLGLVKNDKVLITQPKIIQAEIPDDMHN